MYLFLSIYFQ